MRAGAGAYVCGEETSLLNSLEGKRGEVRAKPPLPALQGLFGKPTVVNNVLTLCAVHHILAEGGAEHYQSLGIDRSKGTMPIQLAGNIKHGGLYETAFGITLDELIYDIGGGTQSGRPVKAVQVGGPLGAYIHPDQFEVPFDYEAYARLDALIGHAGITVFDDTADMGAHGALRDGILRGGKLRQVHPLPHRFARGVELIDRIVAGPDRTAEAQPGGGRRPLPHAWNSWLALCALGGFTPLPGDRARSRAFSRAISCAVPA